MEVGAILYLLVGMEGHPGQEHGRKSSLSPLIRRAAAWSTLHPGGAGIDPRAPSDFPSFPVEGSFHGERQQKWCLSSWFHGEWDFSHGILDGFWWDWVRCKSISWLKEMNISLVKMIRNCSWGYPWQFGHDKSLQVSFGDIFQYSSHFLGGQSPWCTASFGKPSA